MLVTDRAAQRLDIQTVPARVEQVAKTRTVGADVVVAPTGRATVRVRLDVSELNKSTGANLHASSRWDGGL